MGDTGHHERVGRGERESEISTTKMEVQAKKRYENC